MYGLHIYYTEVIGNQVTVSDDLNPDRSVQTLSTFHFIWTWYCHPDHDCVLSVMQQSLPIKQRTDCLSNHFKGAHCMCISIDIFICIKYVVEYAKLFDHLCLEYAMSCNYMLAHFVPHKSKHSRTHGKAVLYSKTHRFILNHVLQWTFSCEIFHFYHLWWFPIWIITMCVIMYWQAVW